MKTEKTINLTAYTVEYIDQREPKPRALHTDKIVLDGGELAALDRLGMRPAGYIVHLYECSGYSVSAIHKGDTIAARVELGQLWQQTSDQIEREQLKRAALATLAAMDNGQGVQA